MMACNRENIDGSGEKKYLYVCTSSSSECTSMSILVLENRENTSPLVNSALSCIPSGDNRLRNKSPELQAAQCHTFHKDSCNDLQISYITPLCIQYLKDNLVDNDQKDR